MRGLAGSKLVLWLCLFAPLGGCVTQFTDDVEFVSVEAVDWRDYDEIPGPGSSILLGLVPEQTIIEMGEPVTGEKPEPRLHLKIDFSTRINIGKLIQERTHHLRSDAYFCDRPDEEVLLGGYILYWNGYRFGPGGPDRIWWKPETAAAPIQYYFFTDVARSEEVTHHFTFHGFDLLNEPRDICFTLRGGQYEKLGYKSNTVVVPKAMIEAALRDLPLAFR